MSALRAVSALVLAAGCLVAVAAAATVGAPAAHAETVPPAPAGWTTVFGDDFAGSAGAPPASANWFYDIGTGFGTGEKEHTTNSTQNVYLDGAGHLVLKAINSGGTWTSGRIESTRSDFQAPPGGKLQMTASLRQPSPANALGYWPAFWALGAPMRTGGGWPQSGEIDMMEDVNGLDQASQTLHHGAGSQGHPLVACPAAGSTCQSGYHTYSVIVDRTNTSAETMQFLMDGVVQSTVTQAQVGTAAWQQAVDHGFFIIFDLAIGGNYPDGIAGSTTPTAATTSGGSLSVAYVAVYEQGGNSTPTAQPVAAGRITGLNGLCLSNAGSLNTPGNPMNVGSCNGTAGQQWSTYSDGTVRTQGGCLDVVAAGRTSGTNVDWYPCNASNAQAWTRQANGTLVNPNSGLCLAAPGASTTARLVIETCTGSAQQQWTVPSGGNPGNTVTVANPGNQTQAVGNATRLPMTATDSAAGQTLTWSATGLPPGLSIDPATGIIGGGPSAAGTYPVTVTATDTTGAAGSTTFTWTVNPGQGPSCGTTNIARTGHATSSADENGANPPANAIDGNPATRWASAFGDPEWITVDLGAVRPICKVVLNWEAAYGKALQLQTSTDGATWTSIYSTTTGTGGVQSLDVSGSGRFIRMYGTQRATQYGYSLWEFEVYSPGTTGSSCGTTNAALGRPASASSVQSAAFPAASAVDGSTGTRWSSAAADPQWLQVDLGATQTVCRVVLNWEAAYAKAFQVQLSDDGANWTTVYSTTTGAGGVQTIELTGSGRYLRVYGTQRATQYGYSLWEVQAYSRFTA